MNNLNKIANTYGNILDFDDPKLLTYKIVAVDFDDTIAMTEYNKDYGIIHKGPNHKMIQRIHEHRKHGALIYLVTARIKHLENKQHFQKGHIAYRPNVQDYIDDYSLHFDKIIYTNDALKGLFVETLKAQVIYDDAWEQIEDCLQHGVDAVVMN